MNQSYQYDCRCLELTEGPVYVDFDFIPEEPTYKQIRALLAHTCETCAYRDTGADIRPGCNPALCDGKGCKLWAPHWDCESDAINRYWLDLHRRTMKGKPVPIGRRKTNHGSIPYISYPEDD